MLKRVFPFLSWARETTPRTVRADFIAGLTVGLVLIPQSMAYAQLAGLPVVYGLYAAFLPPMVAALFGSSRQLATGPVAIAALLTAATLEPLATAGSAQYVAYAIVLALVAGVFQFLLGVLRLGVVVNFLSYPVINAYTNAAAIIIATSQVGKLLGVTVDAEAYHLVTVWRTVDSAAHYFHWPTLAFGAGAFALIIGLRRISPRIPAALVAVAAATALSWMIGYEKDARVSLDAIRHPAAVERIERLNRLSAEQNAAIEERIGKAASYREMRRGLDQGQPELLEAELELSLLERRIEALKSEADSLRTDLRRTLFLADESGGPLVFYDPGGPKPDTVNAREVWRLRLPSGLIDPESIAIRSGGAVVGEIPAGLPPLSMPELGNWGWVARLIPMALVIALLGFTEAISIAKAIAAQTGQRLDPNQELIGQGLAKIAGAFTMSFPTSGSFSRSALSFQAGAKTGLSSVFTSAAVAVTLLFLTPLLYHLPESALAAVIMHAVLGLVSVRGMRESWLVGRRHVVVGASTFLVTLAFAPHLEIGLFVGVTLSLCLYIYQRMRPAVGRLSKHPDGAYRDAERHGLALCRHIAVIRFEGTLFFANTGYLEDKILEQVSSMPELRCVLLQAATINEIDVSGYESLRRQVDQLRDAGYDLYFAEVHGVVMDVLRKTGLDQKIGADHFFATLDEAVRALHGPMHADSGETECPLLVATRKLPAGPPAG